jgi:hypothetical protein
MLPLRRAGSGAVIGSGDASLWRLAVMKRVAACRQGYNA